MDYSDPNFDYGANQAAIVRALKGQQAAVDEPITGVVGSPMGLANQWFARANAQQALNKSNAQLAEAGAAQNSRINDLMGQIGTPGTDDPIADSQRRLGLYGQMSLLPNASKLADIGFKSEVDVPERAALATQAQDARSQDQINAQTARSQDQADRLAEQARQNAIYKRTAEQMIAAGNSRSARDRYQTVVQPDGTVARVNLDTNQWETTKEAKTGNVLKKALPGSATDLTPEEREALNKALDGRLNPKDVNRYNQKMLAQKALSNPNYDFNAAIANGTLERNAGFQQKAILAEQVPGIVKGIADSGKKLNYAENLPQQMLQFNYDKLTANPDLTEYMTKRNDGILTLAGVMRGNGATDMSTKLEEEAAHPSMSPAQLNAWLKAQQASLQSRLETNRAVRGNAPGNALAGSAHPSTLTKPDEEAEYQAWKRGQSGR